METIKVLEKDSKKLRTTTYQFKVMLKLTSSPYQDV